MGATPTHVGDAQEGDIDPGQKSLWDAQARPCLISKAHEPEEPPRSGSGGRAEPSRTRQQGANPGAELLGVPAAKARPAAGPPPYPQPRPLPADDQAKPKDLRAPRGDAVCQAGFVQSCMRSPAVSSPASPARPVPSRPGFERTSSLPSFQPASPLWV